MIKKRRGPNHAELKVVGRTLKAAVVAVHTNMV